MSEPLRSGALPEDWWERPNRPGGDSDGLAPGQAARIADAILSEPETGRTGAAPGEWDHMGEIAAEKRPRRNRHLDGYGDERGRY